MPGWLVLKALVRGSEVADIMGDDSKWEREVRGPGFLLYGVQHQMRNDPKKGDNVVVIFCSLLCFCLTEPSSFFESNRSGRRHLNDSATITVPHTAGSLVFPHVQLRYQN